MQLVGVLVSGIRGAENGTVGIYQRGTSTFAQQFTSFDGTGAFTPVALQALDQNGGLVTYVNEEVDIFTFSSGGASIRAFTFMGAATDVEVISQSFTGTPYAGGGSAASNPVPLSAVLDTWKTNAGAIDWKVLVGGAATTLKSALGSLSGLWYNVQATAYGAKGDGTTDDTSAIQAAITAASGAGGGTVFFPTGTYKTTAALTMSDGVNLLGSGAKASKILLAHASAHILNYQAASTALQTVSNLTMAHSQSNTGDVVECVSFKNYLLFHGVVFGDGTNNTGHAIATNQAGTIVAAIGCTFRPGALLADPLATLGLLIFGFNRFVPFSASGDDVEAFDGLVAVGNVFENGSLSGAITHKNIAAATSTGNPIAIVGNVFEQAAGGSTQVTPWQVAGEPKGAAISGNAIGPGHCWADVTGTITVGPITPAASTHEGVEDASRGTRRYYVLTNAVGVSLVAADYGTIEIERTTNGNQTVTFDQPPGPGLQFSLVYYNHQGAGSGTVTLAGFVKSPATFTVNANVTSVYHYRSIERGANSYWSLVGSDVNVAY